MEILVVVDMQNDFIDGSLGTKEAQQIVPEVVKKIQNFEGDTIIYTMDTHWEDYLLTQEGRNLPVEHCIINTDGWKLNKDVLAAIYANDVPVLKFEKRTFGSYEFGEWITEHREEISKITFIGLCTGICVISNAMIAKAAAVARQTLVEAEIIVDAKCCACVTPESHQNALKVMQLCQIKIENWDNQND